MTENTKNMLQYLNDFVQVFDEDYSVTIDDEFSATFASGIITVCNTVSEVDFYFIANMYRHKDGVKMPLLHPFTWSFLHELGHLETEYDVQDDRAKREKLNQPGALSVRDTQELYSLLHNERIANNWAQDFVLENTELIRTFDSEIVDYLRVWYNEDS